MGDFHSDSILYNINPTGGSANELYIQLEILKKKYFSCFPPVCVPNMFLLCDFHLEILIHDHLVMFTVRLSYP